jgi:hypothetical protein
MIPANDKVISTNIHGKSFFIYTKLQASFRYKIYPYDGCPQFNVTLTARFNKIIFYSSKIINIFE